MAKSKGRRQTPELDQTLMMKLDLPSIPSHPVSGVYWLEWATPKQPWMAAADSALLSTAVYLTEDPRSKKSLTVATLLDFCCYLKAAWAPAAATA